MESNTHKNLFILIFSTLPQGQLFYKTSKREREILKDN